MADHLSVYIGWDSKEPVTFHVAASSLLRHASRPVSITPLVQPTLRSAGLYTRPRGLTEATEFSLTRFLCPALSGFQGYSLFLDSDVLVQADIWDLLLYPQAYPDKAVYVCQHDYIPCDVLKFDGHEQTTYPRKNWSSVILFDNAKCQALTPDYVNKATGLDLHRFNWLKDDQIGSLPLTWNHLVGEYPANPDAKILHYTRGAPCFHGFAECDQAEQWKYAFYNLIAPIRSTIPLTELVIPMKVM